MKEMKTRIISALIMIALLVPILIIGGKVFAVAIGMIGVIALKELSDLKEIPIIGAHLKILKVKKR